MQMIMLGTCWNNYCKMNYANTIINNKQMQIGKYVNHNCMRFDTEQYSKQRVL